MADDLKKNGGASEKAKAENSRGTDYFAKKPMPDVPPSKPLQWFLLGALIITGAAYVVGEWTDLFSHRVDVPANRELRQRAQNQSAYLGHIKLAGEAFSKKQFAQAVSEYRLALQTQNTAEAHEGLGEALLKQGSPEDAFVQFGEALHLNPALVNVASAWASALDGQGRPEDASRVLRDALARNPESGLLRFNLGTTWLQMRINAEGQRRLAEAAGKSAEAQAAATNATTLAQDALGQFTLAAGAKFDSAEFWRAYGELLNELGRHAEAEPLLMRAVSEDAGMAPAHFDLANAECDLGNYAGAIEHYEKVLTLIPDDLDTLNKLALLYATATNTEARSSKMAVQLATRICDATTGQNARYMDTLAGAYAADGNFFEAITTEDKAIHRATQLNDTDLLRELQVRQSMFMEHRKP